MTGPSAQRRYRRPWSRPLATLIGGFARNPRLAWQLSRGMRLLDKRALRQFSLAIHGKDFLADIYTVAGELGMRPFLMWGTLLGAVREGGPMRHDTDIDLGLLAPDYALRRAFIDGMLRRGYFLTLDVDHKFRLFRPHLLHADFDLLYPAGDQMICLAPSGDGSHVGASFAAGSFDRLRPISFAGDLEVFVPDPPEAVLETIYGPDWREPRPGYDSASDLGNRLHLPPGQPLPPLP